MDYLQIGLNVSQVVWFVGTVIMLVKPLLDRVLPKIGLPFNDYPDTDTAYQELCYAVFYDEDLSPIRKAGGWLLFVIMTQIALFLAGFFITLMWPLGIIFLIVWFVFSKKNKNKED